MSLNPLLRVRFPLPLPAVGVEGEERLEHLGLGAYTPAGLVQNFLRFLHLHGGLPW